MQQHACDAHPCCAVAATLFAPDGGSAAQRHLRPPIGPRPGRGTHRIKAAPAACEPSHRSRRTAYGLFSARAGQRLSPEQKSRTERAAAATPAWLAIVLALGRAGRAQPAVEEATSSPALRGDRRAPPPRSAPQSSSILGGGENAAFERQLEALRGYPVVVNKWASWCGPCRFEFPFFQRLAKKHGKTIAFLGVDSRDSREEAAEVPRRVPRSLSELLRPQRRGRAGLFRGDRAFPTTAFYDRPRRARLHQAGRLRTPSAAIARGHRALRGRDGSRGSE